jgi:hypothetical protein
MLSDGLGSSVSILSTWRKCLVSCLLPLLLLLPPALLELISFQLPPQAEAWTEAEGVAQAQEREGRQAQARERGQARGWVWEELWEEP